MKTVLVFLVTLFFASSQLSLAHAQAPEKNKILTDDTVSLGPPGVVGPLLSPSAMDDPAQFPARGGNVDWGLALSGGGIRSASFSIGVMKALYEKGLLNDIDVISSVSGGGYASYWLLTNYGENKAQPFGAAAFADDVFLKNVCELQLTSDFLRLGRTWPFFFLSKKKSLKYYEGRIERSFEHPRFNSAVNVRTVTFLDESIQSGNAPYFILNTSLDIKQLGGLAGLVEITPDYIGNPVLGFAKWSSQNEPWSLVKGVAVSAAALKVKLEHETRNYAPHILSAKRLELWDGGGFENLAALPLIRRGVKNIIIVDAEEDSKYKFESYTKLQRLLAAMGIDFHVGDIDTFLSEQLNKKEKRVYGKFVSEGSATWRAYPISSKIYYVKAAPLTSDLRIKDETDPAYLRGMAQAKLRDDAIECRKCEYKCGQAPPLSFAHDFYLYVVNKYVRDREGKNFQILRWNFPQVPTTDQNLNRDTMEALLALGYLEGSRLSR